MSGLSIRERTHVPTSGAIRFQPPRRHPHIPLARQADPRDIAYALLFLPCLESSYVTAYFNLLITWYPYGLVRRSWSAIP